jgi:hypothetical protein
MFWVHAGLLSFAENLDSPCIQWELPQGHRDSPLWPVQIRCATELVTGQRLSEPLSLAGWLAGWLFSRAYSNPPALQVPQAVFNLYNPSWMHSSRLVVCSEFPTFWEAFEGRNPSSETEQVGRSVKASTCMLYSRGAGIESHAGDIRRHSTIILYSKALSYQQGY